MALALTYRLGRDHFTPRVGLYATAALGLSAFFIQYLHELRMYSLVALLTVSTLWLYSRVIRRSHEPSAWEWLALFLAAVGLLAIGIASTADNEDEVTSP